MLQQFYINLDKCKDKRERTEARFPNAQRIQAVYGREETVDSILPYRADPYWRDPFWNRRMTNGEVGCTLSHVRAWKLCVTLNRPIVVLEDDAEIMDPEWLEKTEKHIENFEFLYLGYKHVDGPMVWVNDEIVSGGFCYWTVGYCITPGVAQLMLDYCDNNPIIPADELMPAVLGAHRWSNLNTGNDIHWGAFAEPVIAPEAGAFDNSEIEIVTDVWQNHDFHVITVGTDPEKMFRHPDYVINLGEGVEWKGGTMEGPGGGQKLNLVKPWLETIDDNDIVMFVDGYDTFIPAQREEILKRYYEMRHEIVFSAEPLIWPDRSIADRFEQPENGVPYLNSGTYIGTAKALREFLSEPIEDHEDDQLYCQLAYLSGKHNVCLDHESYIFFCLSGQEDALAYRKGWVINESTHCTTCVVHGNGGGRTKDIFEKVYDRIYGTWTKEVVKDDIIILKSFLPEQWCKRLIDACEDDGGWKQLPGDKFPGQEIRLNTLKDQSLMEEFREYYETIESECEKHWPVLKMNGIRDLFVIKYAEGVQTTLPLHHDMSQVSAMVRLNHDYTGGETYFPRQEFDNGHLKTGDVVLWPAQVTHPHQSLPLKSGTKYGLVLWTQRYEGEGEYRG